MLSILGILLMFIVGIYLTIKLKFIQFNPIYIIRSLLNKETNKGISPIQTLFISLAACIGVGSLSGTVLAIYIGGIGSVFWMWITTIICSSNVLSESILGVKYRRKIDNELYEGGPFYYIKEGLNKHKLALIYAIVFLVAYVCGFLTIQSNTIGKVLSEGISLDPIITGLIILILVATVIFGGVKGIAKTVSKLIPIVAIIYIIFCLVIVLRNINIIDNIFINIIKSAFNLKTFFVGLIVGVQKSIFSTEAGIGSTAIASAASSSNNPLSQGLIQVFGICFDTFVISTLTVFVILTSSYTSLNLTDINGIEITKYAFNYHLGNIGDLILIISITLFALSTIIGGYYYIETTIKFITKSNDTKIYKILALIIIFIGTIISSRIIWKFVDIFIILLGLINTYAIFKLRHVVFKECKKYVKMK
jgi:alanine or glycine:cation symporter, AGCS family